jgi:hypothetical protein
MAHIVVPSFQKHRKNEIESLRTEHLDKIWLKKRVYTVIRETAYAGFVLTKADESAIWLVAILNTKLEKLLFVKRWNANQMLRFVQHTGLTERSIRDLQSAAYGTYRVQHTGLTECSIRDLQSAAYGTYRVQRTGLTECSVRDLQSAAYGTYRVYTNELKTFFNSCPITLLFNVQNLIFRPCRLKHTAFRECVALDWIIFNCFWEIM